MPPSPAAGIAWHLRRGRRRELTSDKSWLTLSSIQENSGLSKIKLTAAISTIQFLLPMTSKKETLSKQQFREGKMVKRQKD
jgi:hypothetical protein